MTVQVGDVYIFKRRFSGHYLYAVVSDKGDTRILLDSGKLSDTRLPIGRFVGCDLKLCNARKLNRTQIKELLTTINKRIAEELT